jgi:hypothetical protein
MFDTLRVEGSDRERFRAPWGETYDDFQSKGLCELIDEPYPLLNVFTLRDGALTCASLHAREYTVGSGKAYVHTFARGGSRGDHKCSCDKTMQTSGWVEWEIEVTDGRLVSVMPVTMSEPCCAGK